MGCKTCIEKANEAFQEAVKHGAFEYAKMLLDRNTGIDPSLNNNQALRVSIDKGYDDITELLLEHERMKKEK